MSGDDPSASTDSKAYCRPSYAAVMIQRATAATPRLMYLIIRRSSLKTPEPTTNAASLTAPQSNARRRTLRLSNTLGFYFEYSPS